MFSKLLTATTVVLATTQLVAAQTSTACDPTKKSEFYLIIQLTNQQNDQPTTNFESNC